MCTVVRVMLIPCVLCLCICVCTHVRVCMYVYIFVCKRSEEESSKAAPPTRASIMRQPSQDVVPVAKQPPVQQPAGTTNAPPRLNYAPLAGNIASTSPALQATPSRDVAVEVPDGPSLPPPPGPPAPSSVPAPPPAAPAMAPQPIQPIVPPSNRPALVQAVGHSRRGRATPGNEKHSSIFLI